MGCEKDKTEERFKVLASALPLIKGSIITDDGKVIDLSDYLDVPKTPIDPQLAKAQNIYPYIRDRVIFQNGKTCTLTSLIEALLNKIHEAGEVYSDELRLTHVALNEEDWNGS